MIKYYIIAIDGGFWAENYREFRGWLYASGYNSKSIAQNEALSASKIGSCYVQKIYLKG